MQNRFLLLIITVIGFYSSFLTCSNDSRNSMSEEHEPMLISWARFGRLEKLKAFEALQAPKSFFDSLLKSKKKVDWNIRNKKGETPLIAATRSNQPSIIEFLLQKGADYTIEDEAGKTALEYGLESKNPITIKLFNDVDHTPLTCAILKNNSQAVSRLINIHKVPVNAPNKKGKTPLMVAILQYNHSTNQKATMEIINELLKHGAKVNISDPDNKTALHHAVEQNLPTSLVDLLIPCTKINEQDKLGNTYVHYAAQNANQETIYVLCKKKANPSIPNKHNEKPIDVIGKMNKNATAQEKQAIAAILEGFEQHPETKDRADCMGAKRSSTIQIKPNPSVTAQPSTSDSDKKNQKAALEHRDPETGRTLLTQAVTDANNVNVIKLLEMGAPVDGLDGNGNTPLITAIKKYDIKDHQNKGKDYLKIITILLEHKASLKAKDSTGKTPLHYAAWFESFPILGILGEFLKENDNKNALIEKDASGDTPLHYAAAAANPFVIEKLLELDSSAATIKNKAGLLPSDIIGTTSSVALINSTMPEAQKKIISDSNKKKCRKLLSKEDSSVLTEIRHNSLSNN